MTHPPPSPDRPTDEDRQPPEAALGGADAVEKTTYVVGSGTEPERIAPGDAPGVRRGEGGGPNTTWAIVVFLAVGAVLVYLLGWGR